MKTTLDLPPRLVRELELLAAREGRKPKDVAADLLSKAITRETESKIQLSSRPSIEIQANGLPVVRSGRNAPASKMSTSELLELEQASLFQEDLRRLDLTL